MIRIRRPLQAIATVIALSGLITAQAPQTSPQRTKEQQQSYRKAMEDADQKIADEVKAHSELMKNLEYLTTEIGPRLTGSKQMQEASDWTLERFQDYGVEAHLETTNIDHAWTRGTETAEITSPIHRSIGIRALGWSKATNGDVSGKVIALDIHNLTDLDAYKGKLKGAIVLVRKPAPVQLSYLGYPGTTGLSTMDYRLTDAIADPPGEQSWHTEQLLHLPGVFCCYAPPRNVPLETSLLSARIGVVTFGSLHKLEKLEGIFKQDINVDGDIFVLDAKDKVEIIAGKVIEKVGVDKAVKIARAILNSDELE